MTAHRFAWPAWERAASVTMELMKGRSVPGIPLPQACPGVQTRYGSGCPRQHKDGRAAGEPLPV